MTVQTTNLNREISDNWTLADDDHSLPNEGVDLKIRNDQILSQLENPSEFLGRETVIAYAEHLQNEHEFKFIPQVLRSAELNFIDLSKAVEKIEEALADNADEKPVFIPAVLEGSGLFSVDHIVLITIDPKKSTIEYFDSQGKTLEFEERTIKGLDVTPNQLVEQLNLEGYGNPTSNSVAFQKFPDSNNCGVYVSQFMKMRAQGCFESARFHMKYSPRLMRIDMVEGLFPDHVHSLYKLSTFEKVASVVALFFLYAFSHGIPNANRIINRIEKRMDDHRLYKIQASFKKAHIRNTSGPNHSEVSNPIRVISKKKKRMLDTLLESDGFTGRKIINAYVEHLKKEELEFEFVPHLINQDFESSIDISKAIFDNKLIFIPMFLDYYESSYIVLLTIDPEKKTIEYFDPQGGTALEKEIGMIKGLNRTPKQFVDELELGDEYVTSKLNTKGYRDKFNNGVYVSQFIKERAQGSFEDACSKMELDTFDTRWTMHKELNAYYKSELLS